MSATAAGAICRGDGAKTKPTATAPMPTASSASASEVTPQILTNSLRSVAPRTTGCGHGRAPRSPATADGPVGRAHQRLPHQDGRVAGVGQPVRRRAASRIPDSATADHARRASARPIAQGPLAVHLEGAQVPLVDPDQLGARPPGPGPVRPRRGPPPAAASRAAPGQGQERAPARRRRGRPRSAARRRPPSVRASHTSRGDDREVLAQDRQAAGRPGRARSVGAPAEELPRRSAPTGTRRPPASYSAATVAGSRSGSRSPLDGERRLISEMTAMPRPARRPEGRREVPERVRRRGRRRRRRARPPSSVAAGRAGRPPRRRGGRRGSCRGRPASPGQPTGARPGGGGAADQPAGPGAPAHTSLTMADAPWAVDGRLDHGGRRGHAGGDRGRPPHLRPGGHVPASGRVPGAPGRRRRVRPGRRRPGMPRRW